MATVNSATQGYTSYVYANGLADGEHFDVTTDRLGAGMWNNAVFVIGGSCDVRMVVAHDGDFSNPDQNILLDSFDAAGISEGNTMNTVGNRVRWRFVNTSGGPADYFVAVTDQAGEQNPLRFP